MSRIILKNLPKTVTESELLALVSPHGEVESTFVSNNRRLSGKFAFVTYKGANAESAAKAAIEKLNGKQIDGQGKEGGIIVEIATQQSAPSGGEGEGKKKAKAPKQASSEAGGAAASDDAAGAASSEKKKKKKAPKKAAAAGGEGGAAAATSSPAPRAPAEPSNRVYITRFPSAHTPAQLKELLETVGPLKADVTINHRGRKYNATAEFVDVSTATRAIEKLNGHVFEEGKPGLSIAFAHPPQEKQPKQPKQPQEQQQQQQEGKRGRRQQQQKEGGAPAAAAGAAGGAASSDSGADKKKKRNNNKKGGNKSAEGGAAAAAAAAAPAEPAPPAARLCVKNLPAAFVAKDLSDLMSQAGELADECFVSANRRLSGKFGFVLFKTVADATKALNKFNGVVLDGQGKEGGLAVEYARAGQGLAPSEQQAKGGNRGNGNNNNRGGNNNNNKGGRGGQRRAAGESAGTPEEPPGPNARVFVSNLPRSFTAEKLTELFSQAGTVTGETFVSANPRTSGKFGFVNFASVDAATAAVKKFTGHVLDDQGREGGLVVQYAKESTTASN